MAGRTYTANDLTSRGVNPAHAAETAQRLNSIDPSIRDRYANAVVQFASQYGPSGYDITLNRAGVSPAEQRRINATISGRAAAPQNSWHTIGAAGDFSIYKNGVIDKGVKPDNAYKTLLPGVLVPNGLVNPFSDDVGHVQPIEVSERRFGKTLADFTLDPKYGVSVDPVVVANMQDMAPAKGVTPEAQSVYSLLTQGNAQLGIAPLPAQVAAGAVGNMMQESYPNLRPDAKGAAGELGIGQWMPDRYANMVAWTTANGLDPNSRKGQALFYSHELQTSPVMAKLAAAKTPGEAAQIIAQDFERAGNPQMDKRMAFADAVAGAPVEGGIQPVADAVPAALGFGGVPVGMVADTQAAPVSQDIPAGPYGADKVVTAMQNGDVAGATKALNDLKVNAALSFNPFTNGIDKIKTDVTNYFKSQLPVVQAAFTKYPALTKAVPADMRPAVDAAQKAMPVADTAAIQPVSFPKTSVGAWGVKPQDTGWTYEPADQSATDATKSIYDTLASNDQAAQSANRMNAWSSFTDRPFEAPKSVSPTEYAGGGNFFLSKPKTDTGVSAWSNAGAGQGFGLGTLQPSTPYPKTDALAGRDPLTGALAQADKAKTFLGGPMAGATLASALATPPAPAVAEDALPIAGVSFLVPPVAAAPVLKTAIAKPAVKAPATPVRYGSTGGAGVAPRSGGISAFGLSPSVLSAITAAKNAGYTTGIASPGYTSTSGYQNAMANGYTAPNFSQGSGGAIYSYKPNGQGGGTYVTTDGRTLSY